MADSQETGPCTAFRQKLEAVQEGLGQIEAALLRATVAGDTDAFQRHALLLRELDVYRTVFDALGESKNGPFGKPWEEGKVAHLNYERAAALYAVLESGLEPYQAFQSFLEKACPDDIGAEIIKAFRDLRTEKIAEKIPEKVALPEGIHFAAPLLDVAYRKGSDSIESASFYALKTGVAAVFTKYQADLGELVAVEDSTRLQDAWLVLSWLRGALPDGRPLWPMDGYQSHMGLEGIQGYASQVRDACNRLTKPEALLRAVHYSLDMAVAVVFPTPPLEQTQIDALGQLAEAIRQIAPFAADGARPVLGRFVALVGGLADASYASHPFTAALVTEFLTDSGRARMDEILKQVQHSIGQAYALQRDPEWASAAHAALNAVGSFQQIWPDLQPQALLKTVGMDVPLDRLPVLAALEVEDIHPIAEALPLSQNMDAQRGRLVEAWQVLDGAKTAMDLALQVLQQTKPSLPRAWNKQLPLALFERAQISGQHWWANQHQGAAKVVFDAAYDALARLHALHQRMADGRLVDVRQLIRAGEDCAEAVVAIKQQLEWVREMAGKDKVPTARLAGLDKMVADIEQLTHALVDSHRAQVGLELGIRQDMAKALRGQIALIVGDEVPPPTPLPPRLMFTETLGVDALRAQLKSYLERPSSPAMEMEQASLVLGEDLSIHERDLSRGDRFVAGVLVAVVRRITHRQDIGGEIGVAVDAYNTALGILREELRGTGASLASVEQLRQAGGALLDILGQQSRADGWLCHRGELRSCVQKDLDALDVFEERLITNLRHDLDRCAGFAEFASDLAHDVGVVLKVMGSNSAQPSPEDVSLIAVAQNVEKNLAVVLPRVAYHDWVPDPALKVLDLPEVFSKTEAFETVMEAHFGLRFLRNVGLGLGVTQAMDGIRSQLVEVNGLLERINCGEALACAVPCAEALERLEKSLGDKRLLLIGGKDFVAARNQSLEIVGALAEQMNELAAMVQKNHAVVTADQLLGVTSAAHQQSVEALKAAANPPAAG